MPALSTTLTDRRPAERLSIVLAAIDCVVGGGHSSLTIAQVADEAGLDAATVRMHFPTTPALAEAVMDYVGGQVQHSIHDELAPDDRLRLHFNALAAAMQDRPGLFVVLAELEVWAGRDQLIRSVVKRSEQAWRDALARLLHEGRHHGVWARQFDDEAVVELVIAAAVGVRLRGAEASRTLAQIEAFLLDRG